MKKVLFLFAAAIAMAAVMSSCSSKKETQKIGDQYELTEVNGKFGMKDVSGHVVLTPDFDQINDMPEFKAVFATQGDLTTIVVNGSIIASGIKVESVTPVENNPAFAYIVADGGKKLLWRLGTGSTFGPFTDICLIEDIVFLNTDGKWGATTTELKGLAPRQYDKIIVVKNGDNLGVLVHGKEWSMYDRDGVSNGAKYNIPAKQLEKQIKGLNLGDKEVAVANVDWKL